MKVKTKKRFFPTPKYLKKPSLGLDISDRSIKYCFFDHVDDELILGGYGRVALEAGIIKSGKIIDIVALRNVLNNLAPRAKRRNVRVALSEEQVYLFSLKLPLLKQDEVRGSVGLSIEEHVPISMSEAVFDYDLIKKTKDSLVVQVAVVQQEIVESYLNAFKNTPFVPSSFELEEQALARAVIAQGDMGTYMIVDFGETRTGISIVSEGFVLFTSTIEIGGHNLNEAIAKQFSISTEEAKKIKEEYGLETSPEENKNIMPIIVGALSALQDEINKHYVFWDKHPYEDGSERPKINAIYLCGGEANMKGIENYLSQTLRTKVKKANPWKNITDFKKIIPDISFEDSILYATAFGLALGDTMYD